jgi:predicted dehydrogenase
MTREKVTIVGVGGWGTRVAEKLVQRGDVDVVLVDDRARHVAEIGERLGVEWSSDPAGYFMVTGTARSTVERGNVIIATPPDTRVDLVRSIINGYGLLPKRVRVEKPLAIMPQDAGNIVRLCNEYDVNLSVGFTLLHHPLYAAIFDALQNYDAKPVMVHGTRIGPKARHAVDAIVDLGSHTASIAAYLDVPSNITARFSDDTKWRTTEIELDNGSHIFVDEHAQTITAPDDMEIVVNEFDALEADLDAWLSDTHRADARVALQAAHIVYRRLERLIEDMHE